MFIISTLDSRIQRNDIRVPQSAAAILIMKIGEVRMNELHVSFILDETGSMSTCRDTAISSFNEYLNDLKGKEEKIKFTLTKFNSEKTEIVCSAIDVKHVAELNTKTYVPNNLTPLYDAIGKTINSLDGEDKALIVILTDGFENASKEHTQKSIFDLIEKKKKKGWTFVYLGANQDAWAMGGLIGITVGNTLSFDYANYATTMSGLSCATQNYVSRGGTQTSTFFEDAGLTSD